MKLVIEIKMKFLTKFTLQKKFGIFIQSLLKAIQTNTKNLALQDKSYWAQMRNVQGLKQFATVPGTEDESWSD